MHILPDRTRLPLPVGLPASNLHDSDGLKPTVAGHPTQYAPAATSMSKLSGFPLTQSLRSRRDA
ncbi:hypothetical protein GCM10010245_91870 [Streptomyces spectabilis]|uniref:Uncharacterized protein n=1 Tax=Streptomyces spectabilis TaxID=68270 RepID=A0A7W8B486_STRST|nr:hypothetical protein [Streptomyces spectabilis]GGV58741.1 hypothetical protein GCM10010245_91870 [Streptomyces spectabilis]